MMPLLLALITVAALALVGTLAVRRRSRTRPSGLDLWPGGASNRSLLARQRLLAETLPAVPAKVVHLPVGPGAEGAQAARRLLDRSEAA
jgi:hypothetical protein